VRAYKERTVCMVNSFRSELGAKKALFDLLTDFAMFGAVIFETLAVTTIFVFRRRLAGTPRVYRCPGYPWTPLLSLVVPVFVLVNMVSSQTVEAVAGLGFIGLGALVFWGFQFRREAAVPSKVHEANNMLDNVPE